MKKTASIVISAVFGLGIALSVPAFGSEAGIGMPSMKDMAKGAAKQVAQQKVDEAHDTASKKLDAMVDGKAEKAQEATSAANATAKKAEKTVHEMKQIKEHAEHLGK